VTSVPVARANLAVLGTRIGLHGHTHIPVAFREEDGRIEVIGPAAGSSLAIGSGRLLLNPGSVGQPRDGIPTASYAIVDTDAQTCSWRRVPYDIPAVQAAMIERALPPALAARLAFGL
jgi:diadenosine tetraphosphatase ApaH/serine/threonine PP2A family protein phosphatase